MVQNIQSLLVSVSTALAIVIYCSTSSTQQSTNSLSGPRTIRTWFSTPANARGEWEVWLLQTYRYFQCTSCIVMSQNKTISQVYLALFFHLRHSGNILGLSELVHFTVSYCLKQKSKLCIDVLPSSYLTSRTLQGECLNVNIGVSFSSFLWLRVFAYGHDLIDLIDLWVWTCL